MTVDLGGSSVNNLADSLLAFGLVPGSADLFSATYTVFGDLVSSQYPELLPSVAPADQVIDKSYLQDVAKQAAPTRAAIATAKPTYAKRRRRAIWSATESGTSTSTPARRRSRRTPRSC